MRIVPLDAPCLTFTMLAATLAALAFQAASPTTPPQTGWTLGRDASVCVLERQAQLGDKPSVLQLRAELTRPEIALDLVASAQLVPRINPDDNPLTLSLGGIQAKTFGFSKPADADRRLLHTTLPLEALDRMPAGANELTITAGKESVTIPAPTLAAATAALRSCHSGWLRGLGLDPVAWATGRQPTLVNPGRWITPNDYPRDGIGIPYAKVTVLLRVDAEGRITACEAIAAAAPTFGKATCAAVMARGSAKPAVDPAGKPVAGATFMTTTWTSG